MVLPRNYLALQNRRRAAAAKLEVRVIGNDRQILQHRQLAPHGEPRACTQEQYHPPNHRKIFAWAHNLGAANQRREEMSSCSSFIERLSLRRLRIELRRSSSASVKGSGFTAIQPLRTEVTVSSSWRSVLFLPWFACCRLWRSGAQVWAVSHWSFAVPACEAEQGNCFGEAAKHSPAALGAQRRAAVRSRMLRSRRHLRRVARAPCE